MYYIYYKQNGQIVRETNQHFSDFNFDNELLKLVSETTIDISNSYVSDGIVKKLPDKTNSNFSFNYETFAWEDMRLPIEKEIEAKLIRNQLLLNSDWTDTLSSRTRLGDTLYNAWQEYRQQLRDITAQPGYPSVIDWPTAP